MSPRPLLAAASAAALVCSAVLTAQPAVAADGVVLRAVPDGYAYEALTGASDDEAVVSNGRLVLTRHAAPGFQQVRAAAPCRRMPTAASRAARSPPAPRSTSATALVTTS